MDNPSITPSRLALARRRRGLSAAELARRLGITSQAIYDFEKGRLPISQERVEQIAQLLAFPVAFFAGPDLDEVQVEQVSFRARSRIPAPARDATLSAATLATELSRWIDQRFNLPPVAVPTLQQRSPAEAADYVRARWGLAEMQPMPNMVHLLEAHGVRVFSLAPDYSEVDAFSFWRENIPFVMLNTMKSGERGRFDAAHELGHLVLHSHNGCGEWPRESEREADEFAANLLMPRYSVQKRMTRNSTAEQIVRAKRHWGVAALALAYRINELGMFTDWAYRRTLIELGKLGFRTGEPGGIPRETSQVIAKISKAIRASGTTRKQLAEELLLEEDDFSMLIFGLAFAAFQGEQSGTAAPRPTLQLVAGASHRPSRRPGAPRSPGPH